MNQRKRKTMRGLILAFAVVVLVLPPAAQAKPISSQQSQLGAATPYPDMVAREMFKRQHIATNIRHADDRAGIRGVGSTQTAQVVTSNGTGFDWKDASLGAGAAVVALLILTSGVVISRRERGKPVAA
jgi:hypothetical protein